MEETRKQCTELLQFRKELQFTIVATVFHECKFGQTLTKLTTVTDYFGKISLFTLTIYCSSVNDFLPGKIYCSQFAKTIKLEAISNIKTN